MAHWMRSIERAIAGRTRGRDVTVYSDDVFLVSYPKSGNTWLRFLLAHLICRNAAVSFGNVEDIIPDIYLHTDRTLISRPRPRILKSHEYFDPRYKNVIYLARDPRDVVVSYYYHSIKFLGQPDDFPKDEFVARFVRGELDAFGSWGESVGSWVGARSNSTRFLLLRYEDLLEDTVAQVRRIASFLGWSTQRERLETAVSLSSAERMRNLEKTEGRSVKQLRQSRSDKLFVRTGRSGNWQSELSTSHVDMITTAWKDIMQRLGYAGRSRPSVIAPYETS